MKEEAPLNDRGQFYKKNGEKKGKSKRSIPTIVVRLASIFYSNLPQECDADSSHTVVEKVDISCYCHVMFLI